MRAIDWLIWLPISGFLAWIFMRDFADRSVQLWWRVLITLWLLPSSLLVWAVMRRRGEDPFAVVVLELEQDDKN